MRTLPGSEIARPCRATHFRAMLRRAARRRLRALVWIFGCWLSTIACEEEFVPPPEPQPQASALTGLEVDVKHNARISGDQSFLIPNIQLIIQQDRANAGSLGLTLWSARPSPDGARLLFGTFAPAGSLARLTKTPVDLGGGRFFNPQGNGIFSAIVAYQPKLARLEITEWTEQEATGRIKGEFYRFRTVMPTARPEVVELEIRFSAAVLVR